MKDNYFVFLDIDGVLWDWKFRLKAIKEGLISRFGKISDFNPESMKALNNLITIIDENYNCKLVISSTWRDDMEDTKRTLFANGLEYTSPLECTPIHFNPFFRGKEIKEFLQNYGNSSKYVVIDDGNFDFKSTLIPENIIKTNIANGSLNMNHIKNFFKNKQEFQSYTTKEKETSSIFETTCDSFEKNPQIDDLFM